MGWMVYEVNNGLFPLCDILGSTSSGFISSKQLHPGSSPSLSIPNTYSTSTM